MKRCWNAFDRRRLKREARAAADRENADRSKTFSFSGREGQQIEIYDKMPITVSRNFDLARLWKDAASPKRDSDGNVLEAPKFPLLAVFTKVYHSVDSTSCRSERDFSALAPTMIILRYDMTLTRVHEMMFLELNVRPIPEVAKIM